MRNIMKKIALFSIITSLSILLNSCFGSMNLTKKVYNLNQSIDNKFARSALFWGMIIVPVYGACSLIDVIFLNTIEFWTGKNPINMAEGEVDSKLIEKNGRTFEITMSRYNCRIKEQNRDNIVEFIFNPESSIWNVYQNKKLSNIANIDENILGLFSQNN